LLLLQKNAHDVITKPCGLELTNKINKERITQTTPATSDQKKPTKAKDKNTLNMFSSDNNHILYTIAARGSKWAQTVQETQLIGCSTFAPKHGLGRLTYTPSATCSWT
jgi:hypothetical protein